ncbi:MAG: sensor histidine kinase [Alphaproteobacteria bacterium]
MKPNPISIQRRLAWRLLAIFLVMLGVAFAGFLYRATSAVDLMKDRTLQAQASTIAEHVSVGSGGTVRVALPKNLERQYADSEGGYFFAVYGSRDRIVATSSPDTAELLGPFVPSGTASRFFRIETRTRPYFGYITSARGLRIVVAQAAVHNDVLMDSIMNEFLGAVMWWVVPIALIAVWIGVITIRTSLAPLKALSESAATIGPATTSRRLAEDRVPVEVLPLVRAVNVALDRLEQGFEAQRRFTADAAHQLRTPLALLQARIDSMAGDVPMLHELRRDVDRLHRIIAQLLRIARLDSVEPDLSAELELNRLTADTLAELAPLALGQGIEIGLEREEADVRIVGNRELLSEAVANLVENAIAHAPRGSSIAVRVTARGTIEVLDRGPGVKDVHRAAIFERFWRAPGSANAGAGLGLAIVADIARIHGGDVAVEERPGGGAAFTLRLPVLARDLPDENGTPDE